MPVPKLTALPGMTTGRTYEVTFRSRDRKLGSGSGTYTYDGPCSLFDRHKFTAADGSGVIYLDADEITTMAPR